MIGGYSQNAWKKLYGIVLIIYGSGSQIKFRALNVNGIGAQQKREKLLKRLNGIKDDFIILVDTRLRGESLKKAKTYWTGNIHSSINDRPNSSGGILILAKRGLDIIPRESGQDSAKMGRMAWEIYEIRGHKMLVMGI